MQRMDFLFISKEHQTANQLCQIWRQWLVKRNIAPGTKDSDPGKCPTLSLLCEIQQLFRRDCSWIEWRWHDRMIECRCPLSLQNFKTKITFSFGHFKCWQQMQDLGCSIIQWKPFCPLWSRQTTSEDILCLGWHSPFTHRKPTLL